MPTTAFSRRHGKELDVEQLLRSMSRDSGFEIDTVLRDLPVEWRHIIRTDVECPSCFTTGAELVAAGRSKINGRLIRQACFRFKDGDGGNGHHPFCDFVREDEEGSRRLEDLVPFGSAKSDITRAVRELVCRGVKIKVFDQRRMRDMRQWFFETKQRAQFEVQVDSLAIEWAHDVCNYAQQSVIAFDPLHADIPGFNWEAAAKDRLWRSHRDTIEAFWQARLALHIAPFRARAKSLVTHYHGQIVFDPSVLREEYRLTRQLCNFMCNNYAPLRMLLSKVFHRETRLAPPALLALSALLLYVSEWRIEVAVEKLVAMVSEGVPFNEDDGNFMGLNPFHDFDAWHIVRGIQELVLPLKLGSYDCKQQYRDAEGQLRQEHAQWRLLNSRTGDAKNA